MTARVTKRFALAGVVGACALFGAVPTAGAQAPPALNINCNAAGTVYTLGAGPATWTISGRGSCFGDFGGTYFLDFTGVGNSETLGFCSPAPDTVRNLSITVTGTLTNTATLASRAILQTWHAPNTTFPVTTPFTIAIGGNDVGAGTVFTRIFGKCPTLGSPVSTFYFSFPSVI